MTLFWCLSTHDWQPQAKNWHGFNALKLTSSNMEAEIKKSFCISVFFLLCHCTLGFYEILSGSTTIPQEYANSSYVNRVRIDMMKKDLTL